MPGDWETLIEKESYREFDGIETRYFDLGTGKPICLLHGGGMTSSADMNWGSVIEPLAEHCRVIAPDQPGFGFTPIRDERDYDPRERARFVATMLEDLDADGLTVVGNSKGGYLAVVLGLTRTDLVDKVVIVNSGSASRKPDPEEPTGDLSAPEPTLERAENAIRSGRTKNLHSPDNHPFYRKPITDEKIEYYYELQKRNHEHNEERNRLHKQSYEDRIETVSFEGEHISERAAELEIPTLLTWSTTPQVRPRPHYKTDDYEEKKARYEEYFEQSDEGPMDSGLELFQTIPDAEIHIWQNAKHHVMADKVDRWVDVVTDFHHAPVDAN